MYGRLTRQTGANVAVYEARALTWWECAAWGAFGGLAVELVQLYGALRRTGGWPWRQPGELPPRELAATIVIRVFLGLGLAMAAGQSGQVSGAFGAIAVGVAAPLVVEQMLRNVRLDPAPSTAPAPDGSAPPEAARIGAADAGG